MRNLLFIFGTRPEAIKMAPLIVKYKKQGGDFRPLVCVTAQHREMLDQVLEFFEISPDFDLSIMQKNQTLFDVTARALKGLEYVINQALPELIFVQGDTTTSLTGALAGFYGKIKIAHIEAGLRSHHKYAPFPEEINRKLISHLADYHFAPTEKAVENLQDEGIQQHIYNVGNTVIDALYLGLEILQKRGDTYIQQTFDFLDFSKKIVLITGHRRENFGEPFLNICRAIKEISEKYSDTAFVYPVHLNPNVQKPVNEILGGLDNVHLIAPLDYPHLIWLMNKSFIVLTDSGGIQEEAPSLGKPVLVMRDVTERQEGVDAGTAMLVGTSKEKITANLELLLTDKNAYQRMAKAVNPYGDGTASEKIMECVGADC